MGHKLLSSMLLYETDSITFQKRKLPNESPSFSFLSHGEGRRYLIVMSKTFIIGKFASQVQQLLEEFDF